MTPTSDPDPLTCRGSFLTHTDRTASVEFHTNTRGRDCASPRLAADKRESWRPSKIGGPFPLPVSAQILQGGSLRFPRSAVRLRAAVPALRGRETFTTRGSELLSAPAPLSVRQRRSPHPPSVPAYLKRPACAPYTPFTHLGIMF